MSVRSKSSKESVRPTPVLMVPLRRCGSHAIRLRLGCSPQLYSPYPLHIVDFAPLVELYGDLSDDTSYFQMITDVVGLQNSTMVKWAGVALDPVAIFDALDKRPRSIHAVTWEMLQQAGESHSASVVMDKSLDSVHYAAEQLEIVPDLRFVNVVRDPRAQVNSMNKAIIHDFDTTLNALTWVAAHDAAFELTQRHPDRVLTIRFEDFVVNAESVLQILCDFLEIEYLPDMLHGGNSDEARSLSRRSALWENNSNPLNPAVIEKYAGALSLEEVEIIETLASSHMERYGYHAITPQSAKSGEGLSQALQRSERRKVEAWERLRTTNRQDYQLRKYRAWYINAVRGRLVDHPLGC